MKTTAVPKLTLSFEVDVEVAYNSFGGKTAEQIADSLQDEIQDMLFELDQVKSVYTNCTAIGLDD